MEDFRLVGPDATKSETIYKPSLTFWQDAWRRFKQNKIALFFLFIILGFTFIAILGVEIDFFISMTLLPPLKKASKGSSDCTGLPTVIWN